MAREREEEKNNVSKKIEGGRKEWSKEWGLEKQTEGLDKSTQDFAKEEGLESNNQKKS